jgi:hypothetical protein
LSIYVEILVRAPMETLWSRTQTPSLHEKWDLRFSRIEYLPKEHETEPQRFRYSTRMGWSFDRLRLWLEQGVDPAQAMRQTLVHSVARVGLALIFAYQGLVPFIPSVSRPQVAKAGACDSREADFCKRSNGFVLFRRCIRGEIAFQAPCLPGS